MLEISSQVDPAFKLLTYFGTFSTAMNMVRRVMMLLEWVEGGVGEGRRGIFEKSLQLPQEL